MATLIRCHSLCLLRILRNNSTIFIRAKKRSFVLYDDYKEAFQANVRRQTATAVPPSANQPFPPFLHPLSPYVIRMQRLDSIPESPVTSDLFNRRGASTAPQSITGRTTKGRVYDKRQVSIGNEQCTRLPLLSPDASSDISSFMSPQIFRRQDTRFQLRKFRRLLSKIPRDFGKFEEMP